MITFRLLFLRSILKFAYCDRNQARQNFHPYLFETSLLQKSLVNSSGCAQIATSGENNQPYGIKRKEASQKDLSSPFQSLQTLQLLFRIPLSRPGTRQSSS